MSAWQPIGNVPRDGRYVMLRARDDPGEHKMRWDAEARNLLVGRHKGLWVSQGNHYTWDESRGAGPEEWSYIQ